MERLTEEKQIGCFASLKDKSEAKPGAFADCNCFYAHSVAVTRLKAYEDTGLEPDGISEIIKLCGDYNKAGLDARFAQACIDAAESGLTTDRLRQLADGDRDGRLVVLPCKVEQLRKMLDDLTSGSSVDAGETYTTGYLYGWKNGRAELLRYILGMSDGGTREAAEAALWKEREHGENT